MRIRRNLMIGAALAGLLAAAAGTVFATPPATNGEPDRATRDKMAQIHEKMAACLRSDRPLADCRQEMMHDCRATLGYRGCRMMQGGRYGGRRGMGGMGGMMGNPLPNQGNPPPR